MINLVLKSRLGLGCVHLLKKPGASQAPVSLYGSNRHAEHTGRLFEAQPGEETKLDNLDLSRIEGLELLQRVVETQDIDGPFLEYSEVFVKG